jgi:prepilin-type N-terminal cleavage/methylation domain-containing protein
MRRTPSHLRGGFTLLEVLMALVIFGLAAVMLGSAYVNVLNSYEVAARGSRVNEDFAFARQIVLTEPDRKKLEEGGEFETVGGGRFKWNVEITSTQMPNLFNVAFQAEMSEATRPEPIKSLHNFTVLRPTWSIDPVEQGKLKEDVKKRIMEIQGKKQ